MEKIVGFIYSYSAILLKSSKKTRIKKLIIQK